MMSISEACAFVHELFASLEAVREAVGASFKVQPLSEIGPVTGVLAVTRCRTCITATGPSRSAAARSPFRCLRRQCWLIILDANICTCMHLASNSSRVMKASSIYFAM